MSILGALGSASLSEGGTGGHVRERSRSAHTGPTRLDPLLFEVRTIQNVMTTL